MAKILSAKISILSLGIVLASIAAAIIIYSAEISRLDEQNYATLNYIQRAEVNSEFLMRGSLVSAKDDAGKSAWYFSSGSKKESIMVKLLFDKQSECNINLQSLKCLNIKLAPLENTILYGQKNSDNILVKNIIKL